MPTIKPTFTRPDDNTVKVTYPAMANGDDGQPFDLMDYPDRSVQLTGTLGAGGTATIEGSNDETTFQGLADPQGNALAMNTLKIEQIMELPLKTRPRITGGDGTTALNVIFICRRQKPVNK